MPRRRQDKRPLMMKFRVIPTRTMRKSELLRLLQRAVRTGVVPDGIEVRYMDWAKGREARVNSGQIPGSAWQDLRAFYHAMTNEHTAIRVEKAE